MQLFKILQPVLGGPYGRKWNEAWNITGAGAAALASASLTSIAAMAKDVTVGYLVELPGRALENRRSGDQGGAGQGRSEIHLRRRTGLAEQQLTDINTMISKGANVLIVLAQDRKAIQPALKSAADPGIPVIAYDRLIEDPARCT